jgi:sugar O-acyltransferase (sialic acid O-acetyltransferase NeuD family)
VTCYLYGAGGHGKVVLEAMRQSKINCDGFIDDDKTINEWDGLPVFNIDILQNMNNQNINLHLAIGNCNLRESASRKLNKFSFISIIHPSAIVSGSAKIDHGNFLAAGIVLGPDTKVGKHCIINHLAVVDHDCIIGDFCHIAPHAILGGGVKIGNGVLIGAGATILPSIIIGDNAIIGAGAVVTKNIQAGMSVVGNPALPLDS